MRDFNSIIKQKILLKHIFNFTTPHCHKAKQNTQEILINEIRLQWNVKFNSKCFSGFKYSHLAMRQKGASRNSNVDGIKKSLRKTDLSVLLLHKQRRISQVSRPTTFAQYNYSCYEFFKRLHGNCFMCAVNSMIDVNTTSVQMLGDTFCCEIESKLFLEKALLFVSLYR